METITFLSALWKRHKHIFCALFACDAI